MKATTKILGIFFLFLFFFTRPAAADVSEEDVRAVASQLGIEGKGYYISVVDYREANAYASRDGHILITRPMLTVLESREQLAFVLAHEVSHIWLGHADRRASNDYWLAVVFGLAVRYGVKDPDWRAGYGAELAKILASRHFSRQQELAADAKAVEFMAERGFNPHAAAAALERMQKNMGLGGGWFATHPGFSERIARVREKAERISSSRHHLRGDDEGQPVPAEATPAPTPIPAGAGRVILKNLRPAEREISLYWYDSSETPRQWSIYRVAAGAGRAVDFTPGTRVCVWLSAAKGGKGEWSSFREVKEGEVIVFEIP